MKNHWTDFWNSGHTTTFGAYFEKGYEGPIGAWWQQILSGMEEGQTILDVGCGNTALLTNLLQDGKALKYIGLDVADIQINSIAQEMLWQAVYPPEILSGTGAEEVPLASAQVDQVVSIFGLEYSDLSRSVPELFRVLKTGGEVNFLLHHASSIVTKMSKKAVDEYIEVDIRQAIGGLQIIEDILRSKGKAALKQSPEAEGARGQINQLATRYLSDTNPATANATMFEFMTQILKFFRVLNQGQEQRQAFIDDLGREFVSYRLRFEEMVSVAKDKAGISEFQELCKGAGIEMLECKEIYDEKGLLAWSLAGKK